MLFRSRAHLVANLDPLANEENKVNVDEPFHRLQDNPELFDFTVDQLDRSVNIQIKDKLFANRTKWTPKEIAEKLESIYTGPIAFEYMHIPDKKIIDWLQDKLEAGNFGKRTKEEKENLLDRVTESQAFSDTLEKKYPTAKKYGAEGCDSGISGMEYLAVVANENGVKQIVVGMPHRGRFNIMIGMFKKPYSAMFNAFNDNGIEKDLHADEWGYSSDVKYHIQAHTTRIAKNGSKTDMVMLA